MRSATVLGIVGAGGIGMILWEYIRGFYYAETSAVLIIIVGSVSLLDMASQTAPQDVRLSGVSSRPLPPQR